MREKILLLGMCCFLSMTGGSAQRKERNVQTSTMKCEVKGQLGKEQGWKKVLVSESTVGVGKVEYVDSVGIVDGRFLLPVEQEAVPTLHKVVDDRDNAQELWLFVDCDEISVRTDKKSGLLRASGSESNEAYFSLMQEKAPLEQQIQATETLFEDATQPREVRWRAEATLDSLNEVEARLHTQYLRAHPKTLLALTIAAQNCNQLGMTISEQTLEQLPEMFKETKAYKRVSRYVENEHLCIPGDGYHDFAMKDINGRVVRLSDYAEQSSYVVLDFWASWCPSCRADMPLMVEMYQRFKDRGIEFIGISLDKDEAKWKQAVKDMGMEWMQLSDLKGWDCHAARINGVNHIPYTIIIAPNGRVMMKDIHGHKLMEALERWAEKP